MLRGATRGRPRAPASRGASLTFDRSEYRRKRLSAEAAAALVRSENWLDYGFGLGQPDRFDAALAARRSELKGVRIEPVRQRRAR